LQKSIIGLAVALLTAAPLHARPLLTEPAATNGRFVFEGGFGLSYRSDRFKDPNSQIETVLIPVEIKLGFHDKLDVGFTLTHASQRLDLPETRFEGSSSGLFSPEFKFSPWPFLGFQFRWDVKNSEENDDLPIGRGNDYGTKAMVQLPTRWPAYLNVGYVFRESYETHLGLGQGVIATFEPGDIFETSGAGEVPVRWGLSALGELAYYRVAQQHQNHLPVAGTKGDAMDALIGITWSKGSWNLGTGLSFGLLDEQHTSFEFDRGAGDYQVRFKASYHLRPHKPGGR
jgi:hypothetical protein